MEMEGGSINGMEGAENRQRSLEVANKPGSGSGAACETILRVLAFILTLAAAIVVGTDKQTKVVPIKIADTLPPVNVPVHAKWHYLSAFVFFLVANAIACGYAAVSLLLALANKGKNKYLRMLIFVLDTFMVALLFSGIGAGTAVGVLGYNGNSHVRWTKVCNVFVRFCHQMLASIALSLAGSIAFLLLLVLPLSRLHLRT